MSALRLPSRLLAAALVLHDLEEALAFPRQHAQIRALIAWAPPLWALQVALVVVTLGGVGLLAWAGRGAETPARRAAVQAVAWILLVNVLVPHVPAAFALGGYAPGVLTAVLVNLPLCLWVLRRTARS